MLLLLLTAILALAASIEHESTQLAELGTDVRLVCPFFKPTEEEDVNEYWHFMDPVSPDTPQLIYTSAGKGSTNIKRDVGNIKTETSSKNVVLSSVTPANAGFYKCLRVDAVTGFSSSHTIYVGIIGVPQCSSSSNGTLQAGEDVSFNCDLETFLLPKIKQSVRWTSDNYQLEKNTAKEAHMNITVTAEMNEATLVCYQSFVVGETAQSVQKTVSCTLPALNVLFPPRLPIMKPSGKETIRGNFTALLASRDLMIRCTAQGNPQPSVQWFKGNDSEPLETPTADTLVFPQIREEDAGPYRCIATNSIKDKEYNSQALMYFKVTADKTLFETTTAFSRLQTEDNSTLIIGVVVGLCAAGFLLIGVIVLMRWRMRKYPIDESQPADQESCTPLKESEHKVAGGADSESSSTENMKVVAAPAEYEPGEKPLA